MLRDELRTMLIADTATTALVGTRIYPGIAPENATAPYVILSTVSGENELTNSGPMNIERARVQVTIWAATRASADAVTAAIKAKCNGYAGAMGTGNCTYCTAVYSDTTAILEENESTSFYGSRIDLDVQFIPA